MKQIVRKHTHKFLIVALMLASAAWALSPAGKFTATTDTVVDTQTGLTWQRTVGNAKVTWTEAAAYCDALVLDGKDDWRLPEMQELYSLVDFTVTGLNPYLDAVAFPDTPWGQFWSATPSPPYMASSLRFVVSFGSNGGPMVLTVPSGMPNAFTRCVR